MLTFAEKRHSLYDINMKLYKFRLYIFCPRILNYVIILNAFNTLNHAVKEGTLNAFVN